MYNNDLQPSKLIPGADFYCFKARIEPKWEDPKYALGGNWTAQTPVTKWRKALLDTYWLHIVRLFRLTFLEWISQEIIYLRGANDLFEADYHNSCA